MNDLWFGIIENRDDPLKIGRCQVRIYGWHTADKSLIPTEDLPWAHPIIPLGANQIVHAPKDGETVMIAFLDGNEGQKPVMLGVVPGIPETVNPIQSGFSDQRTQDKLIDAPRKTLTITQNSEGNGTEITEASEAQRNPLNIGEPTSSRLARGITTGTILETIVSNRLTAIAKANTSETWEQPNLSYAASYPYNKAEESESGHVHEIDDTPGAERLMRAHRTGTYEEIRPDGSRVMKIVNDNFEIIVADNNVSILGDCNITVNGDAKIYVKSDCNLQIDGDYFWTVRGDWIVNVDGSIRYEVGGAIDQTSEGDFTAIASEIHLNP